MCMTFGGSFDDLADKLELTDWQKVYPVENVFSSTYSSVPTCKKSGWQHNLWFVMLWVSVRYALLQVMWSC